MKWAFYILLLANVSFFTWQRVAPKSLEFLRTPEVTLPEPQGKKLMLLSELPAPKQSSKEETVEPASQETTGAPPNPAGHAPAETTLVQPMELKPAGAKQGDEALLGEEWVLEDALEPQLTTRPGKTVCSSLGPFQTEEEAEQAARLLKSRDITSRQRQVPDKQILGYWVLLPPLGSQVAALQRSREIRANGIDNFVIAKGPYKNATSLGLFVKQSSAEKQRTIMESKGLEPQVEPRYRTKDVYWLDFDMMPNTPSFDEVLAELTEKFENIQRIERECKPIALNEENL